MFVRDYRSFMGDLPPFSKLGFRNLQELLRAMPDVVNVQDTYDGCILRVRQFFSCLRSP